MSNMPSLYLLCALPSWLAHDATLENKCMESLQLLTLSLSCCLLCTENINTKNARYRAELQPPHITSVLALAVHFCVSPCQLSLWLGRGSDSFDLICCLPPVGCSG